MIFILIVMILIVAGALIFGVMCIEACLATFIDDRIDYYQDREDFRKMSDDYDSDEFGPNRYSDNRSIHIHYHKHDRDDDYDDYKDYKEIEDDYDDYDDDDY